MKYDYVLITHIVVKADHARYEENNSGQEIVNHLTAGYEIFKSIPLNTRDNSVVLFILRKKI